MSQTAFKYHSRAGEIKKGIRASVSAIYEGGNLIIAVARCSKKDTFTKKIGGAIADGRLKAGKYYTMVPLERCDIKVFLHTIREVIKSLAKDSVVNRPGKVTKVTIEEVAQA